MLQENILKMADILRSDDFMIKMPFYLFLACLDSYKSTSKLGGFYKKIAPPASPLVYRTEILRNLNELADNKIQANETNEANEAYVTLREVLDAFNQNNTADMEKFVIIFLSLLKNITQKVSPANGTESFLCYLAHKFANHTNDALTKQLNDEVNILEETEVELLSRYQIIREMTDILRDRYLIKIPFYKFDECIRLERSTSQVNGFFKLTTAQDAEPVSGTEILNTLTRIANKKRNNYPYVTLREVLDAFNQNSRAKEKFVIILLSFLKNITQKVSPRNQIEVTIYKLAHQFANHIGDYLTMQLNEELSTLQETTIKVSSLKN